MNDYTASLFGTITPNGGSTVPRAQMYKSVIVTKFNFIGNIDGSPKTQVPSAEILWKVDGSNEAFGWCYFTIKIVTLLVKRKVQSFNIFLLEDQAQAPAPASQCCAAQYPTVFLMAS